MAQYLREKKKKSMESGLDNYISIFKNRFKNIANDRKRASIYLILSGFVFFVLLLTNNKISEIWGYTASVAAITLTLIVLALFVLALIYYSRIESRIPLAGWLTYSLCQLYEGIKEIKEVKEEGPLIEKEKQELLSKVVSGPIERLRSMISLREKAPEYLLFKAREISLLKRTKKSLENRIYPNIKEGNENQIRKYLGPLIKSLIDVNFDKYEVALSQLEKGLPKMEIEIPEMRTYADAISDLRRDLQGWWMRNALFRFLILCPGIGVIFYLASFLVRIEPGTALAATIMAAAALAIKMGG